MRVTVWTARETNEVFYIQSSETADDAAPSAPAGTAGQARPAQGPPLPRL